MEWEELLERLLANDRLAAALVQRRISDVLRAGWGSCDPTPYRGRGADLRHEVLLVLFAKARRAAETGLWPWQPGLEDRYLRGIIKRLLLREWEVIRERGNGEVEKVSSTGPEPDPIKLELDPVAVAAPEPTPLSDNQKSVYRAILSRHIPITETERALQEIADEQGLRVEAVRTYHATAFPWASEQMAFFRSQLPAMLRGKHRERVLQIYECLYVKAESNETTARELAIPLITIKRIRAEIESAAKRYLCALLEDSSASSPGREQREPGKVRSLGGPR